MAQRLTYVNGVIGPTTEVQVQVEDRAFQFGDGIYEVVRICHGKLFALQRHRLRMERSAEKIHLTLDRISEQLGTIAKQLIEQSHIEFGQVYIQVSRGVAPRVHSFPRPAGNPTLVVTVSELPLRTMADFERGETALIVNDDRWLHCDIKSTSLLPNVLAKEEAISQGAQEAILAREGRIITEGSSSNVFIVRNGTLYTHPDGPYILPGISKDLVKMLARRLDIPLIEKPFEVKMLREADEVFITSTLHDVCPILKVDNQAIGGGKAGMVSRALNTAFMNLYAPENDLENL